MKITCTIRLSDLNQYQLRLKFAVRETRNIELQLIICMHLFTFSSWLTVNLKTVTSTLNKKYIINRVKSNLYGYPNFQKRLS